jgi:hypothetical protein
MPVTTTDRIHSQDARLDAAEHALTRLTLGVAYLAAEVRALGRRVS